MERPGERITRLRTQKTIALLAWLALHPQREHGREELVERFWPDSDLDQGRASLRVALNALRKVLEPPPTAPDTVLITTRTHVGIRPDALTTDVAAFEAAVRRRASADAIALYTGPFLPGFYEDWVIQEQERLQALRDGLTERAAPASGATAPPVLAPRGALPVTFTRFFGRQRESQRLIELLRLPETRLVTLLGPGGTGKTRLAIETARQLAFDGGVWFVPLAELFEAEQLPARLQSALDLPRAPGVEPLTAIREHLGAARTLFLLDNVEQFVEGAALQLPRLLAELPHAAFLVTSRIRLGLPGEQLLAVSPLPLPETAASLADLSENAAVALFCDRARAALPEFGLTARNAETISTLCRSLEGVPLALELAASWAGLLTPRQMGERFEQVLALEGRRTDREARHLSVRAALRWSLELLPPALQQLFARLAVFRGGFTPDAAAVVGASTEAAFGLGRLREHSLLTVDLSGDTPRYAMLESVREFATELLGDTLADAQQSHARWALSLLERQPPLSIPETRAENENIMAALTTLERTDPESALVLAGGLARPWLHAGLLAEGIRALEQVLAVFPADRPNARWGVALTGLGSLHFYRGDYLQARQCFERRLRVAQAMEDTDGMAESQRNLGTIAVAEGDFTGACVAFEQALAQATRQHNTPVMAMMHTNLGVALFARQKLPEAATHFRAGIALCEGPAFHRVRVNCWHGLGVCLKDSLSLAEVLQCHVRGLEAARELGEPLLIADSLLHCASALLEDEQPPRAAVLLAEAATLIRPLEAHDTERLLFEYAAALAWRRQRAEDAAAFLHQADLLYTRHQLTRLGTSQAEHDRLCQTLQLEAGLTVSALPDETEDQLYARIEAVTLV